MKKTLILIIALTMLLTACKKEFSIAPTPQAKVEPAETCTNRASFVADVTIPDHTDIAAGETFTKTWRVKNAGTCIWTEEYSLAFALNSQMGAPDSIPLETTPPGEELEISVEMTAPKEHGSYRSDFQLRDPNDEIITINNGQYLWVIITVGAP